jgi:hypothetical protein
MDWLLDMAAILALCGAFNVEFNQVPGSKRRRVAGSGLRNALRSLTLRQAVRNGPGIWMVNGLAAASLRPRSQKSPNLFSD